MFKKLSEEDFAVLRGPLKSGRQRPKSLAGVLAGCVIFQVMFLFLEHFVGGYSIYPFKEEIFIVHLWISIILAVLSLIYMIPAVYMRSQKLQYLLEVIVSQNLFGTTPYIMSFVALGASISTNADGLVTLTYITLAGGVVVLLGSFIRYYVVLSKGGYRKGTKIDDRRSKAESGIPSYLPKVIGMGIAAVFIMLFLIRNFELDGIDTLVMCTVCILLFYTMLYVLAEQLIILYCKFRFESFNFELNGRIKPMRDEKGNVIAE